VKIQDSMGETIFFLGTLLFSPWAISAMWLYVGDLQKYMNLQSILNKNSPWVHVELDINMLGVIKKLVKYVIYLSKILKIISLQKVPKQQLTNFWFQEL
jgi:hypothetical protein